MCRCFITKAMLTIRFARTGKRNKAQFKIVLQENSAAPGGRHVAVLGSHDPHLKKTVLKEDEIRHWLEKGAKTSDTVHNLLVSKGLISEKKRTVKVPKKAEEKKSAEGEETVKKEETAVATEIPAEKTEETKAE